MTAGVGDGARGADRQDNDDFISFLLNDIDEDFGFRQGQKLQVMTEELEECAHFKWLLVHTADGHAISLGLRTGGLQLVTIALRAY